MRVYEAVVSGTVDDFIAWKGRFVGRIRMIDNPSETDILEAVSGIVGEQLSYTEYGVRAGLNDKTLEVYELRSDIPVYYIEL